MCLLEGPAPGARELGRARLSPTKPGMDQAPQPGADAVPERPAARRRGGAPAPSQGGLHFLAGVKVLSTPEEKIYFFNYHSPKWAAGPQAFPQLGAIHLPYSQESATRMGVQAAGAVLGRPHAPRTGCPVVCAPNPTSLPRPRGGRAEPQGCPLAASRLVSRVWAAVACRGGSAGRSPPTPSSPNRPEAGGLGGDGWGRPGRYPAAVLSLPLCLSGEVGFCGAQHLEGSGLSVASSPGRSVTAPSPASCQLRRQGRAPQSLTPAPPTCSDRTPGQQPAQTRGPAPSRRLERGAPRCLWAG